MSSERRAEATYQKFARFYDAYVATFRQDLSLYLAMCGRAERILEIGCGTGRVLRCFLESGHSICGVDISDDMLAIAATRLDSFIKDGRLRLINHNFATAPLPEKFQRILVTFFTFNYLTGPSETRDFLANVRRSMEKKALLLIDLFYPLSLAHLETNDQWTAKRFPMGDEIIRLRDKRALRDNLEERAQQYTEPDGVTTKILTVRRYYSKTEMIRLLREAGYQNIKITADYRVEGFHAPADGEATTAGFCVAAESEM